MANACASGSCFQGIRARIWILTSSVYNAASLAIT